VTRQGEREHPTRDPRSPSLSIRRAASGDSPAVLELLNRVPLQLYGEPEFTEEQMLVWSRDPKIEQWVAEDEGGTIVGSVGLGFQDEGRKVFLGANGDPGVMPSLFAFGEEQARERSAPGAVVRTRVEAGDPICSLWEEAGYRVVRHWFHMAIDLGGEPEEPVWPDGVRPREFVRGEDDRAVYDADMEAFADHWDFSPMEYDRWRLWTIERPGFEPGLWVLADAGGEIAGFSINEPHRSGIPAVGRVAGLGVLRPWRKRGVGLALLRQSFRVLRDAGFTEMRLEVDAASPTGAVRLYERAGMHVIRTHLTYEKERARGEAGVTPRFRGASF
jgi:mycothiol synthase